ncbi:trimeric intracellular cation channel family protein [uncultured Ilyobacter sp.]|uniref:trimeric intracellular cation channel family protein n=1 Tax=uncultured Ilyobacter sp. TaxID=544433 RepID=UPI002AA6E928|nr:trimeric intracellular cation channel family protein [uncultured Ilyobacter sp.]
MIIEVLNTLGIVAFSVSGALKGEKHKLDIFGIVVLGVITAVGGGIIRDVVLNQVPDSIIQERDAYLAVFIAIVSYIVYHDKLEGKLSNIIKVSDAAGLAAFTVIGAQKGLGNDLGLLGFSIMATLTGVGGGVLRDMLVNEIPFILKEDVYAFLCLIGGGVYWGGIKLGFSEALMMNTVMISIFIIRIMAIMFNLQLPSKGRLKHADS